MSGIISNVLDLIRLETGNVTLRRSWIVLQDLVNPALERLQTRLVGRAVETVLPENLPALHVDGALVIQVLMNLLENAVKHTPAGTGITIRAALEEGFVRVDVEDRGPGLPAGDPERLFEKFQRGHEESNTGGAGLGLSICRAIVQAHGGRIFAVTRPQGGATFSFTIPTDQR
jgi:two-component system sensor histidine kinase KdpD